jgi:DNA-binding NtrC family response regulator
MSIDDFIGMCERVMEKVARSHQDNLYLQNPNQHEITQMMSGRKPHTDWVDVPTVLLVENEPGLLDLLHIVLERAGYLVLAASSGDSALRLCRQHRGPIHILLSDVLMHPLNGFELAASIKSKFPDAIVLLMSGTPVESFPPNAAPAEFFEKPFSHQQLLSAISRHVRKQQVAGVHP